MKNRMIMAAVAAAAIGGVAVSQLGSRTPSDGQFNETGASLDDIANAIAGLLDRSDPVLASRITPALPRSWRAVGAPDGEWDLFVTPNGAGILHKLIVSAADINGSQEDVELFVDNVSVGVFKAGFSGGNGSAGSGPMTYELNIRFTSNITVVRTGAATTTATMLYRMDTDTFH